MSTSHDSTPRERVGRALRREPARHPPFTWGFGPNPVAGSQLRRQAAERGLDWDRLQAATEDVVWLHPTYRGPRRREGQVDYLAMWGIESRAVAYQEGRYLDEIGSHPLAGVTDPAAYADYPWPRVDEFDYGALVTRQQAVDPEGRRAVRLSVGNPFEIYCWLTGLEEALINLVTDPDLVEAGLIPITGFFREHLAAQVAAWGRPVELAFLADDLGSQNGPLLAPALYRAVLQPFHRLLCQDLRDRLPGTVRQYHTDGSVSALLPDLLHAGVEMLEAVQVECAGMEPEKLSRDFGDRLLFQGAISVQQLLPKARPEEVRRQCRHLIDTLGANGGYLAAPSHAIQAGTPWENIQAMLEEVLGPDRFAEACEIARTG